MNQAMSLFYVNITLTEREVYMPEIVAPKNADTTNKEVYIHFPYIFALIFYIFIMRGEYVNSETHIIFISISLFLVSMFFYQKNENPTTKIGGFVAALLFYIFFSSLLNNSIVTAFGASLNMLCLFAGVFVYKFYKLPSVGNSRLFTFCISALWIYYCVKANLYYYSHSGVARDIISTDKAIWGNLAIGSPYGLAYGCCLIAVYLFGILSSKRLCIPGKIKFVVITMLLLSVYTVYSTQSTITLFSMIIGILVGIWERVLPSTTKKPNGIKLSIMGLMIITLVVFFLNKSEIGIWIMRSTSGNSDVISIRLTEFGRLLYESEISKTIAVRTSLLSRPIEGFMKSPLFGVQSDPELIRYIGDHSELFDALCRYGLIGCIFYYTPFLLAISEERRKFGGFISYGYIISLIIMMTFNPFHLKQGNFALFFILPMLGDMSLSSGKKEERNANLIDPQFK